MNKKIFINLSSYRDILLPYTIDLLFKRAKYPENIVIGLCWQFGDEEIDKINVPSNQIRYIKIPALQSKGACWARSLSFELYDNEDFFWLIDSHICPVYNWDEKLIDQFYQTEDPKALLSCAISFWNGLDTFEWSGDAKFRAVTRATEFYGSLLLQMYEVRENIEKPELNSFLTACNLFGPGSWIKDVPYDPGLFFLGEEISLAVRSFTNGYNHYATRENMAYHKHDRDFRRVFSDDHINTPMLSDYSVKRIDSMLMETNEIPLGIYGLGNVRTLSQYENYAGVKFKQKFVSDRARTGRPDLNYL